MLPKWLEELARQYYAGRTVLFILHGNIHDHIWYEEKAYAPREFYAHVVFRRRDLVFFYNRATGLTPRDEISHKDFKSFLGERAFPRSPIELFPLLHLYFQQKLKERRRIALVIEFAEMLVPNTAAYAASAEEKTTLLYLLQWAQSPLFIQSDVTILLLTESLSELHPKLVSYPHLSAIQIPYPNAEERLAFIQREVAARPILQEKIEGLSAKALSIATGGLTLVQIEKLLAEIVESPTPWKEGQVIERKKQLVEAHAGGLLEFMSTHLTLEAVAGHHAAKAYLRSIAQALKAGHHSVIPMGFLITGPVGTGKTFLLRCFAGEIGVPMVQIKNFRSKWVGETEANLERILSLLEALAPIAVVIDEADTQLGGRDREGDSGVNARVFGRLASFMSDPRHRGRILWFLITARPDLLPVDLKRQGRAEEHIPLFPPLSAEEKREVFEALARRLGMGRLRIPANSSFWTEFPSLSGAEIEAILTRARFIAVTQGREEASWEDVEAALNDFLPPSYPEEVAYMTYVAILECTRRSLLPPKYQSLSREELFLRLEKLRAHMR
ncbi:MAG: AAA family ATPase [Bacteroidia bacterium]|nr:AAA family ATPase [Bacteroidia bacterium]MDW8014605.1 AAA family ATPase [Bacteroidia bacterium]